MTSQVLFQDVEAAAWEKIGVKPRNVLKEFPPAFASLKTQTAQKEPLECSLEFASGASLTSIQKSALLMLVKTNMQKIYEASSWGWNEKKKIRELTHEEARFLLVHNSADPISLLAFIHFRFEVVGKNKVLYCYEIQVSHEHRGVGIGKRLMVLLEILARKFKMNKVMLTVLDKNPGAKRFYLKLGYEVDPDESLEDEDGEGDSYEILSKVFASS